MFTVTLANPVKARKYYGEHGFTKHRKDEPLYALGEEKGGKIGHTRDVRGVIQATSSTLMFVYGDEQTEWDDLEKLMEHLGHGSGYQKIYLFRGKPVKALKFNPERSLSDLNTLVKQAESKEIDVMESVRPDEKMDTVNIPEVEA